MIKHTYGEACHLHFAFGSWSEERANSNQTQNTVTSSSA